MKSVTGKFLPNLVTQSLVLRSSRALRGCWALNNTEVMTSDDFMQPAHSDGSRGPKTLQRHSIYYIETVVFQVSFHLQNHLNILKLYRHQGRRHSLQAT